MSNVKRINEPLRRIVNTNLHVKLCMYELEHLMLVL